MRLLYISLLIGSFSSGFVQANTECPQHFYQGAAPAYISPDYAPTPLVEGCRTGYAILYSPFWRTSVYSAEFLTPEHIRAARQLSREDSFRPDPQFPSSAVLVDYKGSGYDRGHLTPNADAWDRDTQADTFLLSNMIPQVPSNNQGIWAHIEAAVRDYAIETDHSIYIVTGPLYTTDGPWINQRVAVPDLIYKALIDPVLKQGAVYVSPNDASQQWTSMTVQAFKAKYHMDFAPLSPRIAALNLPEPKAIGTGARYRNPTSAPSLLKRLFK